MSLAAVASEEAVFGATVRPDEAARRLRAIDAALEVVSAGGMRSVSLEAVASQAGTSRATLYRWFPGGRDELIDAALQTEMTRFFCALSTEVALAQSPAETCVAFLLGAARRLQPGEPLSTLLEDRAHVLRAPLTFDGMEQVLRVGTDFLWPFFGRWMDVTQAKRASELCTRVGLSYHFGIESTANLVEVKDVRALVATHVAPSLTEFCLQSRIRGSETHVDY